MKRISLLFVTLIISFLTIAQDVLTIEYDGIWEDMGESEYLLVWYARDANSIDWDSGKGKIKIDMTREILTVYSEYETIRHTITDITSNGDIAITNEYNGRRYVTSVKSGMFFIERVGIPMHTVTAYRITRILEN